MSENQPPDCNREIFEKGESICVLDTKPDIAEEWVKDVAKRSGTKIDWHYFGGRANILMLGDEYDKRRALREVRNCLPDLLRTGARLLSLEGEQYPKVIPLIVSEEDILAFKKVLSMTFATREITEENRVARTRVDNLYHSIKEWYQR